MLRWQHTPALAVVGWLASRSCHGSLVSVARAQAFCSTAHVACASTLLPAEKGYVYEAAALTGQEMARAALISTRAPVRMQDLSSALAQCGALMHQDARAT